MSEEAGEREGTGEEEYIQIRHDNESFTVASTGGIYFNTGQVNPSDYELVVCVPRQSVRFGGLNDQMKAQLRETFPDKQFYDDTEIYDHDWMNRVKFYMNGVDVKPGASFKLKLDMTKPSHPVYSFNDVKKIFNPRFPGQ